jgi:hypothetical protein
MFIAVAPAADCTEAAVFRDCPELAPYMPMLPSDLQWIQTFHRDVGIRVRGTLLSPGDEDLMKTMDS